METKIVLTGLGGQGVIFITRLLANTAATLGRRVMVSETHGMSQRGGSVISHVRIDGSQAPLIQLGTADVMLALEPYEALRSLTFLRRGGTAFINSDAGFQPEVMEHLERLEIDVLYLPVTHLSKEMETPTVANVIMVGFASAHPALTLPYQALWEYLNNLSASPHRDSNLRALETGNKAGLAAMMFTQQLAGK